MRPVPALAALLVVLPALSAGAQTGERRFFSVSPGPPPAPVAAPPAPALTQREAIRRWLCPNGGTPMRGRPGRCDGRGRVPMPGGGGGASDAEVAGWHSDLPAATHRQQPCPPGTTPAEARANPGTVRCVPG